MNIDSYIAYDLLQEMNLDIDSRNVVNFYKYNYYEQWSRYLWGTEKFLSSSKLKNQSLTYGKKITENDDRHVTVVIIGFGRMGQAIATQVMRLAHYANEEKHPTEIIVLDSNIEERAVDYLNRYHLDNEVVEEEYRREYHGIPGIRLQLCGFSSMSNKGRRMFESLTEAHQTGKKFVSIVSCVSNPDLALSAALSLPRKTQHSDIAVYVWQEAEGCMGNLKKEVLEAKDSPAATDLWSTLYLFGGLDTDIITFPGVESIARKVHGKYKDSPTDKYDKPKKPSNQYWEELDEVYRWSSRFQVDSFYERLISNLDGDEAERLIANLSQPDAERILKEGKVENKIKYHVLPQELLETMAKQEHNRWVTERYLAGWRFGEKRVDLLLEHPDMKDYEELEEETKNYDRSAVLNMIPHLKIYESNHSKKPDGVKA